MSKRKEVKPWSREGRAIAEMERGIADIVRKLPRAPQLEMSRYLLPEVNYPTKGE
jgi:hypothetical protein